MKQNLLFILKGFASLSIGLGVFQFLASYKVFSFLSEDMRLAPAVVIVILSFCLIFTMFRKDRKFQIPILVVLVLAGISASSMFGHKTAMNYIKNHKIP